MACIIETLDGSKIEIAAGVVLATCNTPIVQADYDGIGAWTDIGVVDNGGYEGQNWDTKEIKPLSGGRKSAKTSENPGLLKANIVWDPAGAGNVLLDNAYKSKTTQLAIRITYPNTEVVYAQGIVTSLTYPAGAQDDLLNRDVEIKLNYPPLLKV